MSFCTECKHVVVLGTLQEPWPCFFTFIYKDHDDVRVTKTAQSFSHGYICHSKTVKCYLSDL